MKFTRLLPRYVGNFDIRQLLPGLYGQTLDMSGLTTLVLPTSQTLTSPVFATGLTASGSAANDFSGSTGTFKTSTGAVTIGAGAISITGAATVSTGKVFAITDSAGLTLGGVIAPAYVLLADNQNQVVAASYAVSHTIFVNDNVSGTYKVAAVSAVFGTAGTSPTLQVEVATSTQAIASGTNQLTGTVSLGGTANTTVNGTIIASPTTITAGSRVNLIFAGTVTNLANASVTVALQRLS